MAKKEETRKTSSTLSSIFLAASLVLLVVIVAAMVRSYVFDKMRAANIYYGTVSDFEQPACVVYQKLIEATPEHRELTRLLEEEELDRNDPEARELMSDAADRVANAISEFAENNDYDLVAEVTYWEKHAPRRVAAGDATEEIIGIIRRGNERQRM